MSNSTTRILVAIIGIPLFLFLIITGGIPFFCLTALIAVISMWEIHKLFIQKNINTFLILDILFAVVSISVICFLPAKYYFYLLLIPVLIFLIELFRSNKNILNPIVSLFAQLYITLPMILLNELEKRSSGISTSKMNYVLIIFILIWTCDSMSYFGGRLLGKHKLTSISPKKTIEGFISGIIFTIIASFILMFFNKDLLNLTDAIVFGIIASVIGTAGDIFESFIKRSADIKDSSNIIPGHGGVLDRFDSLLFVTPFVYVYLVLIRI